MRSPTKKPARSPARSAPPADQHVEALQMQVAALQGALAQVQGGQALAQCAQLDVAQRILHERCEMLETRLRPSAADGDAPSSPCGSAEAAELEEELARARLQLHIAEDEMQQRLQHLQHMQTNGDDSPLYAPFEIAD